MDDGEPRYATLPYVWGYVKNASEIQITVEPFPIGCNLYASSERLEQNGVC
jgi:hypothetical protein